MAPLTELEKAFAKWGRDRRFRAELDDLLRNYAGRPTPVTFARRLSERCGGARIALKREDLLHTGAHKLNNALGQVLLARRMRKTRVIAETGAGQHGVATAAAAAKLGIPCRVYMGVTDMARQSPNVSRMRLLGAEVVGVDAGSKTLKDAINEAMRDWTENVATTHYVLGSALGPHPYPTMVREFQSVIGREARAQFRRLAGRDPRAAVACVGGGSNAIGLFSAYLATRVELYGVEAGGRGPGPGEHAARFAGGAAGVLHGTRTMLLQDDDGQVRPDALGVGRARLSGRRARARRSARPRPGDVHEGVRRRKPWTPSRSCASSKESCRRSSRRTPSPSPRSSPGSGRARPGSSSTSPAGATRISTSTCARGAARRRDAHRRRVRSRPRPEPRGIRGLPHGGRSLAGRDGRTGQGPGPRRGGRAGARRALLRSDRGRARPSALGVACARGRHDARDRLRDCAAHSS